MQTCRCHAKLLALHVLRLLRAQLLGVEPLHGRKAWLLGLLEALQPWHGPHRSLHRQVHGTLALGSLARVEAGCPYILHQEEACQEGILQQELLFLKTCTIINVAMFMCFDLMLT